MRGFFIVAALFAFMAGSVVTGVTTSADAKDCTYTTADKKKGYRC
jgi:hypothetical protein